MEMDMGLLDSLKSQYLNVRIFIDIEISGLSIFMLKIVLINSEMQTAMKNLNFVFLDWGEGLFYRVKGPCT